jgi:hypothetical protein
VDRDIQRSQDGRLVSRAGAHFEHTHAGADPKHLGHVGDDVGLRDSLAVSDGQWMVAVGATAVLLGDELVTRDGAHRSERRRVAHAVRGDERHHVLALLAVPLGGLLGGDRDGTRKSQQHEKLAEQRLEGDGAATTRPAI